MTDASKVQKQAAQWVVLLQTAEDLDRYWPEFEAWLAVDPKHHHAYLAAERAWRDIGSVLSTLQSRSRTPEVMMQALIEENRRRRIRLGVSLAALVCLVAGMAGLWAGLERERAEKHPWVAYERGADQLTPVKLEDGSTVQLNDNTHLRIRVTPSQRQVSLDSGEAYFDVSEQGGRPFDVDLGSMTISSMSAAFSVRREGDGHVETDVKRGVVELDLNHTALPDNDQARAATQKLPVKVNEVATISPSGRVSIENIDSTEMEQRLSWASKVTHLNGRFTEAMTQLNRYTAVRKMQIAEDTP